MPSVSRSQQKLFGACSHGASYASCPKHMSRGKMREFASTKHKGLPEYVSKPARRMVVEKLRKGKK